MKQLNGRELADYIEERQAHQARSLRQSLQVAPKLAIVVTTEHPAIATYVRMKAQYGSDIGVTVDVRRVAQSAAASTIAELNEDPTTHGIIVQLPLENPGQTDEIVNLVAPSKDVDALGKSAAFDPATPTAIMWLLAGYNIDLRGKNILLVGRGRLVGAPLEAMLINSGLPVQVIDQATSELAASTLAADVIVTATGQPGIITAAMLTAGAVVVDAGVAAEDGKTVGDLASDVYDRDDLIVTPPKGGVGPLTICALFDNLLRAARLAVPTKA